MTDGYVTILMHLSKCEASISFTRQDIKKLNTVLDNCQHDVGLVCNQCIEVEGTRKYF